MYSVFQIICLFIQAKEIPGVKIFRCEHSILFVNAKHFQKGLHKLTLNPMEIRITQKEMDKRLNKSDTLQTLVVRNFIHSIFVICIPFMELL